MIELVKDWVASPDLAQTSDRVRTVYGVGFAAFVAMSQMLHAYAPDDHAKFREGMIRRCAAAVVDVRSQVNVNQFWSDVVAGVKSDAFGHTKAELSSIFHIIKKPASPPENPEQVDEFYCPTWYNYRLYFQPDPVIEKLRAHQRKGGRTPPLDRNDLRSQMQTRPYWIPGPNKKPWKQRFGLKGSKTLESCWCIDLDRHELGYQAVSDAEWKASFCPDGDVARAQETGVYLEKGQWVDPRKGDLYFLVDLLEAAKQESQQEAPV